MSDSEDTLDDITERMLEAAQALIQLPVSVKFGALSHPGKVRTNNEDQYAVIRRYRSHQVLLTSLPQESMPGVADEAFTMIVADGMGGAAFGEVASELALRKAWELGAPDTIWQKRDGDATEQSRTTTDEYLQVIHNVLRQHSRTNPDMAGMGTTFTAAYSVGREAFIAHVGDSRAYLIRGREIRQITRDHTLAQQLVDAGVAVSRTVAFQHVLTNCLGGDALEVTTEVHRLPIEDGDSLLLCSDGLSDLVDDEEIRQAVHIAPQPQDACQRLVDLALERGGKDNITVLLARYKVAEPEMLNAAAVPEDADCRLETSANVE